MIALELKQFVTDYWDAISGKAKTPELVNRFVADEDFKKHIELFEMAFPLYELFAEDMVCEGDLVAVRAYVKAVHKGEFLGIPPTNKAIDIPFMVFYKIKDDKIVKGWLSTDLLQIMNDLKGPSQN